METPTPIKPDYFFDTTVLIAYFKDEDPYTAEVIEPVLRGEKIGAVSVVSVAEICAASDMDLPELRDKRLAVLRELRVVPIDSAIAERPRRAMRRHSSTTIDPRLGGRLWYTKHTRTCCAKTLHLSSSQFGNTLPIALTARLYIGQLTRWVCN